MFGRLVGCGSRGVFMLWWVWLWFLFCCRLIIMWCCWVVIVSFGVGILGEGSCIIRVRGLGFFSI